MSILPRSSDFTAKDFDSIRTRLIALIGSVFPTWSAFQTANFGTMLMEMFAWVGDVLTFTQDNQAGESRITTARQRRNLLALVKLLGYTPESASPATTDLYIAVDGPVVADIHIPAGQVFRTKSGIPFQLLSPVVLTSLVSSAVSTIENSTNVSEAYVGTSLPNQSFTLGTVPFLSIVSMNDGVAYEQVDNFLFSNPTDRHFVVSTDNNDRAKITFGDNVSGRAPTATVNIVYKTGGGAAGNVDSGAVVEVDGTILDDDSNPVTLIVSSLAAATGGDDRESAASIRAKAPVSIRAPRTSIAREDFEIHANALAGVTRSLMLTHEQDATIPDNTGKLYVVPAGNPPGTPSIGLLDEVRKIFVGDTQSRPAFPAPLTFGVTALATPYLGIAIAVNVYFRKGVTPSVAAAAIRAALSDFFNPVIQTQEQADALESEIGAPNTLIDFGYYLKVQSAAAVLPGLPQW